jgi:hypothetical protein
MADIITGTTTGVVDTSVLQGEHADIRREAAEHRATMTQETMKGFDRVNADVLKTSSDVRFEQQRQTADVLRQLGADTNEIVKEGLKGDYNTQGAIKDARFDINQRVSDSAARLTADVDRNADRLDTRFFDVARDTQDIRAQIISAQQAMVAGFLGAGKDAEINALKTQMELAKQSTYLSDKIDADGEKTRALVNSLKEQDLNRMLIERNTLLSEERFGRRHWRGLYDTNQFQGQWAALNSQLQAFQSQLQETRQGMVNFGTMAGVGQSSTSNNVR